MSEMIQTPDGWEVNTLKDLKIKLIDGDRGENYPKENEFSDNGFCIFLSAKNVTKDGFKFSEIQFINKEKDEKLRKGKLEKEDIVLTTRGTVGNIAYFDNTINYNHIRINSGMILLRNENKSLETKYLHTFLKSNIFDNQIANTVFGSAQPQLTVKEIEKFFICFPKEKKEQEKIAKILSTLDKEIESTNRLIEKEKNIKTALMQELLTNGIDKNGQIRTKATHSYKESELGLIPDEWEVVSLDQCSTITNSNVDKKSSPEEQEIKLCNYMDVYVNDEIDNSIDFMVATATELEIKKFTLKKDDVIITKDSESPDDIGIPSYVAEDLKDVICGYHLTMIRPKKNCYGKYLALLLQGNYYKKYFGKLASGSTRFALSLGTISQALIALPSITEQKQIAKILTTQDKKIQTEETTLAKLKELKKGLMNDLLSGKVRVKI